MEYKINSYRTILFLFLAFCLCTNAFAQSQALPDTTIIFTPSNPNLIQPQSYRPMTKAWGLDLLMSNNGFGLGMFYRYEFSDELSLMLNFAISDVKDEAEFEQYDYYGNSYIPGKKNRLLLMPLTASIQYRLFKDDIVDNFRPFINAGFGPTMVFVAPYAHPTDYYYTDGTYAYTDPGKIDFFTSLKYGKMRYTLGGYIGAGAYFGMEKGTLTGLSVKYFLAPFPDGIEVMEGGFIRNFGGLFITLTFGSLF
jgi:outer membrane protein W